LRSIATVCFRVFCCRCQSAPLALLPGNLIAFPASDRAATAIKNNGMEPVEKR